MATNCGTQIVIDDQLMEYEPGPTSSRSNGLYHKRARLDEPEKKAPKFQVIHDVDRPRSQSLCLVQKPSTMQALPVEPMVESPGVDSQWKLYLDVIGCFPNGFT